MWSKFEVGHNCIYPHLVVNVTTLTLGETSAIVTPHLQLPSWVPGVAALASTSFVVPDAPAHVAADRAAPSRIRREALVFARRWPTRDAQISRLICVNEDPWYRRAYFVLDTVCESEDILATFYCRCSQDRTLTSMTTLVVLYPQTRRSNWFEGWSCFYSRG